MTFVRVLKSTGFEQAGQLVDWRGPVQEYIDNGTIELVDQFGKTLDAVETVVKPVVTEAVATAEQVEQKVAPEVTQEIADIKTNIAEEEKALETLQTQVEEQK